MQYGNLSILHKVSRYTRFQIIPALFGTTYPISLEIDPKNNRIFFVGTFSASLWIGDITKMKNGTSDGISQIPIPINGFNGIDPVLITTGSIALDSKKNSVWISVLSYGRKGEIFRYDLTTKSFEIFGLPAELNSPLGMAVDSNSDLWITNAGTSIFYKLNTDSGDIIKFVTSKASPRVFGGGNGVKPMVALTATFPRMHILFRIGYRKPLTVPSGSMNRKVTE